jgi:hypothetical protein
MKSMTVDGQELLMDDDVYEFLKDKKIIFKDGNYPYVCLHRMFFPEVEEGQVIDHIDRNKLNFTRKNLRKVSYAQNNINKAKVERARNTSIYKGVKYCPDTKKWAARISHNHIDYFLGRYDDEVKAAFIYDIAALFFYDEYAFLNFDKDTYSTLDLKKQMLLIFTRNRKCNYTGFSGVYLDKRKNIYHARIKLNKTVISIGSSYATALQAAIARDKYCRDNNLINHPYVFLNFPTLEEALSKFQNRVRYEL